MRAFATTTLGLAATFATAVNAHSVFTTLFINGADQGDGTCVRMPKDGSTATNPIASITGNDMACGRDGQEAVGFTCPVPSGSKLSFEWRLYPDYSQPGSIDKSHKGPCAVYLKQVADMKSTPAAGPGWFKVWHEGYDETAKQWCTEKLIANNGLLSVQLPAGLPGGYYLVRPELLALHEADKGDPQFYTGCAQILVDGPAGKVDVPAKNQVSIPGHVQPGEKSVSFNIYSKPMALPYPIPGPEPFPAPAPAVERLDDKKASPAPAPAGPAASAPTPAAPAAPAGSPPVDAGSGSSSGGNNNNNNKGSSNYEVSADGKCGATAGNQTCKGSTFGQCCSKRGRCGSSRFHCAASASGAQCCQEKYGICRGESKDLGGRYQQHKAGSGGAFLDAMRGAGAH
ncbi:hypothetical protein MAPG_00542 [Magnaporthiopsis poae ATCC 64411]|uniref:lytic cellulose monooxygenase (C4-dehydrogenating) n=1 Tax=Magnaporthiopsis poae (strain ATCC 64411 / 73-15) TaxID=644358 RepID=A0A0C4DLA2_MAGP6|nr:hypothetical protein MAPG_00542 [Magnaporthiopsis poae ATCC 64411]